MSEQNRSITDKIEGLKDVVAGLLVRKLNIHHNEICLLYVPQLTNRVSVSNNIIKPLLQCATSQNLTIESIAHSIIYVDEVSVEPDNSQAADYLLKGNTLIFLNQYSEYIVANTLRVEKRNTESPQVETTLRSPRDALTENLDSNLSLIRYRIKDKALKIDNLIIGRRTKTTVAVVYISDVANKEYVTQVKDRLRGINTDAIIDSGYIQKFLSNKSATFFPQIGVSERSDVISSDILDGRICVFVDGSNTALVVPQNFLEFLDAGDDHYDNSYIAVFMKFLRLFAIFITLTSSSLFVAVVAFHPEILPPQYIIAIASSRVSVPVNALLEISIMELVAELLREASIRLPKQIGPTIGIVGTIVIGQAAVAASLVSTLTVIIVSLGTMCSFAVPDYTIMNPIRLLKFMMIFITGIFGLFGFIMGFTIIMISMTSTTSFGIPYTSPAMPFNFEDIKNFFLANAAVYKKRPKSLHTIDKKRK